MKTISIVAQKGGTGKTSAALAIAAGLNRNGYSVLAIDLDAQGDFSSTICQEPQEMNIADVLQGGNILKAITAAKTADVITADNKLALLKNSGFNDIQALKKALNPMLLKKYDYCIVDNAPALDYTTMAALAASDYALVVTEADLFGYQAYTKCEDTIALVKQRYNRQIKNLGFIVNRFNPRATINRQFFELLQDHVKESGYPILQPIRQSIKIQESQALKEPDIFSYAPKATVTNDYTALVDAVIKATK